MRRRKYKFKGWLALLATLLICWMCISCRSKKTTDTEIRDTTHLVSDKVVSTYTHIDTTKVDGSTIVVTEVTLTGDTATISNDKIVGKVTKVVRKELVTHSRQNGISVDSTSEVSKVDSTHYIYKEVQEKEEEKKTVPMWILTIGLLVAGCVFIYVRLK